MARLERHKNLNELSSKIVIGTLAYIRKCHSINSKAMNTEADDDVKCFMALETVSSHFSDHESRRVRDLRCGPDVPTQISKSTFS